MQGDIQFVWWSDMFLFTHILKGSVFQLRQEKTKHFQDIREPFGLSFVMLANGTQGLVHAS